MNLKNSIGFILLVLTIISCSKEKGTMKELQVFRYNEHSNISSLDPAFAKDVSDIWVVNQMFNGLVQLDEDLNVKPDIAKNWSISEDGLTYIFELRDDVYFHKHAAFGADSTRLVTAFDFVYSFNRILDEQTASPGKWVFQQVSTFKAIDAVTFMITLKNPFPPFLGLLSMKYCSVVPREVLERSSGEFQANPIGTGPFKFKLWVANTKLVLRKNPHFYETDTAGNRLPYLEAVAVTFLPDKQSEFLQFVQGNIDFLNSIDPAYKDDLLTSDGDLKASYTDSFDMISSPYLNTEYLGIFMGDSISDTHSIHIRQAMNYGFDREKMIRFLRNGIGTPGVNGFIPKGLPSFSNLTGYNYDPEKARELVVTYKKLSGDDNPNLTITTNSQYVDLCEYIQRELQNIGITVEIDVVPPSTLRQAKAGGKLPVFRASWVADYPDAENYLSLFYSKNFVPDGPNYTHFKNKQFDTWYEASLQVTDNSSRYALYTKMDSLILAEAPIVPLYYDEAVRFIPKHVHGLGVNPANQLMLKTVYKSAKY